MESASLPSDQLFDEFFLSDAQQNNRKPSARYKVTRQTSIFDECKRKQLCEEIELGKIVLCRVQDRENSAKT